MYSAPCFFHLVTYLRYSFMSVHNCSFFFLAALPWIDVAFIYLNFPIDKHLSFLVFCYCKHSIITVLFLTSLCICRSGIIKSPNAKWKSICMWNVTDLSKLPSQKLALCTIPPKMYEDILEYENLFFLNYYKSGTKSLQIFIDHRKAWKSKYKSPIIVPPRDNCLLYLYCVYPIFLHINIIYAYVY